MKSQAAALRLLALVTIAVFAAGCAERYESADQTRPYYGGGETDSPPACPGSGTPTDLQDAPSDGTATEYECPSGDTTTHPVESTEPTPSATTPAGPLSV